MDKYLDEWYNGLINNAVKNVYIFYGIGNGMYADRVLKSAKQDDLIIIYEPDDHIIEKTTELSKIISDERVKLIAGDYNKLRTHIIENTDYSMKDTMNVFVNPEYRQSYEGDYNTFLDVISEIKLRLDMVMNTDYNRAEIRFRNCIANVNTIKDSKSFISLLSDIDKSTPVIIIASGPSLDKNAEQLKAANGKSLIVSVDSALPALLKHDIIPDMYASIDVIKKEDHFNDERINKIPAVGVSSSVPHAFGRCKSNYVIVNDMLDFFKSENIDIPDCSDVEGSVSNFIFGVFLEAGFTNFIFAGADLAFTGNLEHSNDVINDTPDDYETADVYVDDINGGKVRTSIQLRLYIKEFERQISKHHSINVIDATEGGARINGTLIMSLKDAIDKYCINDIDLAEHDKNAADLLNDEQKVRFKDYVRGLEKQFYSLKADLKRANDFYRMILVETKRAYNVNKIKKYYAQSSKVMECVNNNPALRYAELMNSENAKEIQGDLNVVKSSRDDELTQSVKLSIKFNEGLISAADSAYDIFEEYMPIINEEN